MNDIARDALQAFFHEAPSKERFNTRWYVQELETLTYELRDQEILTRAITIWSTHDRDALLAEFERRISPEGFNIGFSFDISDSEGDEDDWLAAYQMAINEVELRPPAYPEITPVEIESWLARQPRRVNPGRPVQMARC